MLGKTAGNSLCTAEPLRARPWRLKQRICNGRGFNIHMCINKFVKGREI